MNHEQAFLQAIREAPDDDAPRLIYADWLEEQGTSRAARADFIRIQCHLDELSDDDPARDRLEDQAEDLLAEHEYEWTQPLHGIAEDWRFSRGFIEHIRIRGDSLLTHAEHLFASSPLRSLHLLIPRNDIPRLAVLPQLHRIASLDFDSCQLNDKALQQLLSSPHLDRLSALHLEGNEINTPGIRALIHSPLFARLQCLNLDRNRALGDTAVRLLAHEAPADNLEILRLGRTNLTLGGLYDLLGTTHFPRLHHLHVSGVSNGGFLQASPAGILGNVKLLAQLHSLDLSGIDLARVLMSHLLKILPSPVNLRNLYLRDVALDCSDAASLAQSTALSNIICLDLARNNLAAAGVQALAESPHLSSLRHLNLSLNNVRDTGAKAIAKSPYLRHLRVLNLSGNGIGGPGLESLAASANLDHLRALHLGGNFVGTDSLRALVESEHVQSLTYLDLSDTFLEEDDARCLASSVNLTWLRTLLLKKNLLGDGGAKALAQSPHLARLSSLDLNDNRIGKAGAEALAAASWRRMRNLDLRGNVFTDTQEALLRKRFGNVVQL